MSGNDQAKSHPFVKLVLSSQGIFGNDPLLTFVMSSSQQQKKKHPATLRKFSTSQFVLHGRSRETGHNGHVAMASVHHNCGCGLRVPEVTTTVGRLRGISETCKKRVEDDPMVAIYRSTLW